MAKFVALTSLGLQDSLKNELQQLGIKRCSISSSGVNFESSWQQAYQVCIGSRVVSRVLWPIKDFFAYSLDDVYEQTSKIDFTKFIDARSSFCVDATVKECKVGNSHELALKFKDAFVDQMRKNFGFRPDVDTKTPRIRFSIKGYKNKFSVAVDLSGGSLAHRGYRKETTTAPLRENLASAILSILDFKSYPVVLDPMCGSGTFLIEAALQLSGKLPRCVERFGFESLKTYRKHEYLKAKSSLLFNSNSGAMPQLVGRDFDRKNIDISIRNARAAKVSRLIDFCVGEISQLKNTFGERGLIVVNPPYGERLGEVEMLKDLYHTMGEVFKSEFKGWDIGFLSGGKDLSSGLGLKATQKVPLKNGTIDCRLLRYSVYS